MKFRIKILSVLPAVLGSVSAQITTAYTDPTIGIDFQRIVLSPTGFSFAMALPQNPISNSEFIGQIRGPISAGSSVGWCGVSFGGAMVSNLLLVAWKDGTMIRHSFRMANGYYSPSGYTGTPAPVATTMWTQMTSTHWTWTFRCQNCAAWTTGSCSTGGFDATQQIAIMGWAQSTAGVIAPSNPNSALSGFHDHFGMFAVDLINAQSSQYNYWIYSSF